MGILNKYFTNFYVILFFAITYAVSMAVATFIENDYGTPIANEKIYRTIWFNLIHLYFFISIIFSMAKTIHKKNFASLIFHLSICMIILGAGLTRFFSVEGILHIRDGEITNKMLATSPTLNIIAVNMSDEKKQGANYFLNIPLSGKLDNQSVEFFKQDLKLSDFKITHGDLKKDQTVEIDFNARFQNETKNIKVKGNPSLDMKFERKIFGKYQFFFSYGNKQINLPFSVKLNNFTLERYPGSMSPSQYFSNIEIFENDKKVLEHTLYVNNVLDFGGYRFFQSSYDEDEKGTIITLNNDPGKNVTYLGYGMLILGSILLLFTKKSRFRKLARFLNEQSKAEGELEGNQGATPDKHFTKIDAIKQFYKNIRFKIFPYLLFPLISFPTIILADGLVLQSTDINSNISNNIDIYSNKNKVNAKIKFIQNFALNSKIASENFGVLQNQNYLGRIEPIYATADNIIKKVTRKDSFLGLSGIQLYMGLLFYPEIFSELKIIYIGDKAINKILDVPDNQKYSSFQDFFGKDKKTYKLSNFISDANRLDPGKRGTFEKDLIKLDERVNIVFSVFSGLGFKIFPSEDNQNWLSPVSIYKTANFSTTNEISNLMNGLADNLEIGIKTNYWQDFNKSIIKISEYQSTHGGNLYQSSSRVKAEIFLIKYNLFNYLILLYILLGLVFFITTLVSILKNKPISKIASKTIYTLMFLSFILHTIGLIIRGYISDHSPFSNAYESMLYISWASAMSGVIFFRRHNFALVASMLLAGVSLFVSRLDFMDPQISPLVPALKSYWLNIHVSIITASYGFLGLCFFIGFITLLLFIFKENGRSNIEKSILTLAAINESSMIIGTLMLTVGNFLGGIWANESWGRYWSWDPKETWSLISICIYALILHIRFLRIKNLSYWFSVASVIGFSSIIMTYFGVNYYLSGLHSYAKGDPIPIPTFVYYLIGLVFIMIIFSFLNRKIDKNLSGLIR